MQLTFAIPSRGEGLAPSLPYRQTTPIAVTIEREPSDAQDAVLFEVVGSSALNGTAAIVEPDQLLETGVIEVSGDAQTEPGSSGHLFIRAVLDGDPIATSDGFSVCAHPTSVENGPQFETITLEHAESDGSMIGLKVWIRLPSDSGVDGDLSSVQEMEVVADAHDFTGAATKAPKSSNSKWQLAHQVQPDRHRMRADVMNVADQTQLHGANGGWSNDQLDVFYCPRCGMAQAAPAPIANSGYRVTRVISTTADNKLQLVLSKHPQACIINDFQAEAGPSQPIEITATVPKKHVNVGSQP